MSETVGKKGRLGEVLILMFVVLCTAFILAELAANIADLHEADMAADKTAAVVTAMPVMTTPTPIGPRPTATPVGGPTEGALMEEEG